MEGLDIFGVHPMPRAACEVCGQPDAFVYAVPMAFGRTILVCMRCLNLPQARADDDADDEDEDRDDDTDELPAVLKLER
jgi:hypothetical protein